MCSSSRFSRSRTAPLCRGSAALVCPSPPRRGSITRKSPRTAGYTSSTSRQNAERFEKTGEMGIGITKPGVGPNGETVVGDNERAIQLISSSTDLGARAGSRAAGADHRLARRQDPDHDRQRLPRDVQPYPGALHRGVPDDNTPLPGTAAPANARRLPHPPREVQARRLDDQVLADLRVPAQFPAVTGANVGAILEDAAFDVDFSKGKGLFRAHIGQFKPPFGAQEMTSSGNQMFVDRALVSNVSSAAAKPASPSGARRRTTRSSGASACSTATA